MIERMKLASCTLLYNSEKLHMKWTALQVERPREKRVGTRSWGIRVISSGHCW